MKGTKPKAPRASKGKVDPLQLLVNTGIALSEIDDYNQLLAQIADTAMQVGHCEGVTIYQVEGNNLRYVTSRNRVLENRGVKTPNNSFVMPISDKTISGYVALSRKILNINDVYELPEGSSYSFNPLVFDKVYGYRSRSMVALPMCDTRGTILGVLQLINHYDETGVIPFSERVEPYLRALASQVGVVMRNATMSEELRRSRVETVKRFVKASEYHDADTGGHIERMSSYSALLAQKLGMDAYFCERIKLASMLHDVGKISIPDAILKKPGLLTDDERKIMNTHAVNGYEMLADAESPFLQMGAVIAWSHHEKWDGTGYPRGLRGEDIPLEGRIVALADVFDALCSRRCYKEAWPIENVLDIIRKSSGSQFDPQIVEVFFENLDEIYAIQAQYPISAEKQKPSAYKASA